MYSWRELADLLKLLQHLSGIGCVIARLDDLNATHEARVGQRNVGPQVVVLQHSVAIAVAHGALRLSTRPDDLGNHLAKAGIGVPDRTRVGVHGFNAAREVVVRHGDDHGLGKVLLPAGAAIFADNGRVAADSRAPRHSVAEGAARVDVLQKVAVDRVRGLVEDDGQPVDGGTEEDDVVGHGIGRVAARGPDADVADDLAHAQGNPAPELGNTKY